MTARTSVGGKVADGLARWYCNRCHTAPVDTFASAEVVCNKGHSCTTKASAATKKALRG
jgi:hypothetical protein